MPPDQRGIHNASGDLYAQNKSMSDFFLRLRSRMTSCKSMSPVSISPGFTEISEGPGSSTGSNKSTDSPVGLTAAKTMLYLLPHGNAERYNVTVVAEPDVRVTRKCRGFSRFKSTSIPGFGAFCASPSIEKLARNTRAKGKQRIPYWTPKVSPEHDYVRNCRK